MKGFYTSFLARIVFNIVIIPDDDPRMLLMSTPESRILAVETVSLPSFFKIARRSAVHFSKCNVAPLIWIRHVIDIITAMDDQINIVTPGNRFIGIEIA